MFFGVTHQYVLLLSFQKTCLLLCIIVSYWGQAKFGISLLKSSEQIFDCLNNSLPLSALFKKNGQKERVTQLSVIKELVACCYVTNH